MTEPMQYLLDELCEEIASVELSCEGCSNEGLSATYCDACPTRSHLDELERARYALINGLDEV